MKTNIIILVLSMMLFSSCEDLEFIQEDPNSDIILLDVNEQTIEGVVLGAYEPLTRSRGRLWESIFSSFVEQCAEYSYSRLGLFNDLAINNFGNLSDTFNGLMWATFYEAIGRSNFIISSLADNSTLAETQKNQAIGEARFIRAICYYNMVRAWGSIPLRTTPIANSDDVELSSSSVDAIYLQIIEDLLIAETNLPTTVGESNAGRATQGAAKVALADVYLTLGDFNNARIKSKEVIDNKATYGYDLVPSLELLFSASSPTNEEEVFALKFAQITGQGSFLPTYAADSRAADAGLAARGLEFMHTYNTIPLIANWDDNDLRKSFNLYDEVVIDGVALPANLPIAASNSIAGDYFYGKYKDPDAPEETAGGNDFYLFRYADALLIFAESENQINGPTNDAYEAINMVRRRGYGLDINTISVVADLSAGLSQTEFDDMVFRERGYEFFFECKRWFDLKRTGRWASVAVAAGKPSPTNDYWPIPSVELANNPGAGGN